MFARLAIGMCVALGMVGAIVEATLTEYGPLVALTQEQQAAALGGQFMVSDCVIVGQCPSVDPPPGWGMPCSNPGGLCTGTVYCYDDTLDKACKIWTSDNPLNIPCLLLSPHTCKSDILECHRSGFCIVQGRNQAPNPTKCGTAGDCLF